MGNAILIFMALLQMRFTKVKKDSLCQLTRLKSSLQVYLQGAVFWRLGPYEQLDGVLHFTVDPKELRQPNHR
ncbi:MAG: hypothetical protein CM1200mP22_04490 [Dehalococcoidia bacterium]|nr:MAG: hypothetical protein CM1200mP22_04490 [Dehalococcoidia bacterium]